MADAERKKRAEFAFIAQHAEKMIWTTDPEHCFVPARVLKELPNGDMELEVGASATVKTVKKADLGPWILHAADLRANFEDMVRMTDVNEATILQNLRTRFMTDDIYTNIGTILVSINPFKWMPKLYGTNLVMEHLNTPPGEVSSPHVFQIAAAAYVSLRGERLNQSIIISGESGAGKTEATKQCLKFFAEAAGATTAGMSEKLLHANPILEAFGNAKTVRNNNSSRFGKWMEVHFNGRAQICGSQIINYLLEKSRVVFQAPAERNYHIFYMLPLAATPEQRARFSLTRPEEYVYTNKSAIVVDGLDDIGEYKELLHSFGNVEITEAEYDPLLQIVAGLLHLSNISLEALDSDTCRCTATPHVQQELRHAARLLGVEADALQKSMEQKLIETRNERVWSPLTVDKAIDSRNSMAKAIYGRMFDWLVQRVNSAMEGSLKQSSNVIGVLDIFGFEIFEKNSFEQLCINFCNEKLQQHFNYHVFKLEEKCYKAEEIDYSEIVFVDNQDVLDLVERKPDGLLPMLDDECKVPRGSDQGYLEKINKLHAANIRFKGKGRAGGANAGAGGGGSKDGEFGVNHYAGTVNYNVTAFLEKNKDDLLLNIKELMTSSNLPLIPYLFSDEAREATAQARAATGRGGENAPGSPAPVGKSTGGGADKQTQSTQFRGQLDALMKTLNSTEPHYIRCIKPNSVKKGNIFEAPICLQQLRYAGVFEAVRVRQLGFPFRWTYDAFFKRYRYAANDKSLKARIPAGGNFPWREKCRLVLEDVSAIAPKELTPVEKVFKFGKTMVLYRADQARVLEMIRDHVRVAASIECERVFRGHSVRKLYRRLVAALVRIRAAIRGRVLEIVQTVLAEAKALPRRLFAMKELEALLARLLEEKACREKLEALYILDPADHYAEYENALKDAKRLDLADPIVGKTKAKFATVKDRLETKANLKRGIEIGDRSLILRSLAKAEELKKDWGDIVPAAQLEAAHQMLAVIQLEEKAQENLKSALRVGGPRGAIGALDCSQVDIAGLEAAVAEATSGRVNIKTAYGANLITTCRKLRDLRSALKVGVWDRVETAVQAMVALRAADQLVEEAEAEVKMAEAEVADRRIQNELLIVLSSGAPRGPVGELDMASADVINLTAAIARTKESAEHVGGLSPTATHLLASAELILRLRQSMVSADWSNIKKAVHEGLEARLAEQCLAEVVAAKAELDNHAVIHQLTDALEKGYATGPVSRLDLSAIDTIALTDRIAHAEEVGPKTAKAHALLKLARIIRKLREAMREHRFAQMLDIAAEANSVPSEFTPPATAQELLIAKYEGQNVVIVKALSDALTKGGAIGTVGRVDMSAIDIKPLAEAIKLATTLKCRSSEAMWLFQVSESLVQLRQGFKDQQWSALRELIGEVLLMDGTKPSSSDSSSGSSASGAGAGVSGSFSRAALSSSASSRSGSDAQGTNFLAGITTRARGSSQEKRPSWSAARVSLAGALGSTPAPLSRHVTRRGSVSTSGMMMLGADGKPKSPEKEELFYLPREVQDETRLIEDELNNFSTISDLTARLSVGGPTGELGMIDASAAEVDALAIVLKKAQRVGIKTPLAAALCYTGQVVRELRQYLRDKDQASVEATLRHVATNNARVARSLGVAVPSVQPSYLNSAASSSSSSSSSSNAPALPTSAMPIIDVPRYAGDAATLEQAAITLVMPGLAEVIRVEAEAQYRRVMEQMTTALASGAAGGIVGKIDASSCDVTRLAVAIDSARALGSRTKQARHLTALCRLTWQMRSAVMEDDWRAVESLLVAGAAVLGTAEGQTDDDRAAVPPAVRTEMDLYRGEAYNRRIVETFRVALRTKQAAGEIGRLNLGEVDAKPLEDSIRLAISLGVRTPEAKCLLTTAVHMRALRLSLLGGNWNRLGELLDYYFTAEERTKPYHRFNCGLALTQGGAAPGTSSSSSVASVLSGTAPGSPSGSNNSSSGNNYNDNNARPYTSTNTKDGLGTMATWPGVIEAGDGYDLSVDGVAMESAQESNILQLELNNRNVIVELTKACASGSAQGGIGRLDVSTLRTGELDWAIDYANRIGCMTLEAEQVLATAVVLRRIRMALGTGNWTALDDALASARGKELADVGATEIQAAQDELDNRVILSELASSLAKGRPQGRVGRLYTGNIDLKPLNDAIALSARLGPKTQESKQMLFTAKVVARLRMCLLNNDLPEASLTLEAINGKPLASVAIAEVLSIEDEVNNWTVISELGSALSKGAAGGSIGALDLAGVDTVALVAALNHADQLGVKTTEAGNLYAAAAQAYKLRSALLKDNWSSDDGEGVEAILAECEGLAMSDLISPELDLVKGEVHNRRIIMSLAQSLARGAARGPVGEMNVADVDTAELDLAIAQASELGTRTEEAERLLHAAKTVRRLRSVLLAGNWQWVGSVLLEARQLKHIFPPVSLKELQSAQDELDNKAIIAQINASLRQGVPTGSIGHIDPESVDISVIDEALGYARSLGVKSVEASSAVAGAQIIRKLRVAVKANDWSDAKEVLESIGGRTLPTAANDELQQVRLCVDNWKLIQDLTISAATGGPIGPLGDPDIRALRVDALDAAIALSGKLGVHTVEARRALVTALIVRRLRSALIESDWSFLSQVLAEADAEADALLPQVKNEIVYAKDTVDFRSIMTALSQATESQDESALIEALSRSQRLHLVEHPRAHVKQTVETATMSLTRIQRCKAALAAGVKGMDAPALVDALAMAAGMGFTHTLVEEARRVLARVQDITDRATGALRNVDAIAMASVLRECDNMGLQLPVLGEIRRTMALPRSEFLRRELDAVLTSVANGSSSSAAAVGTADALVVSSGGQNGANSTLPSRGPSALELRLINCTVQIKDIFFGDAPDSDDVIAAALGSAGAFGENNNIYNTNGSSPTGGNKGVNNTSPGRQQLHALLVSNPQAAAAIASLRVQRNTDENVRGTQIRLSPTIISQQAANPMFLFAGPTSGAFRAEGYLRSSLSSASSSSSSSPTLASMGAASSSSSSSSPGSTVGSTTPPIHSPLRRQFSLDKYGRIKPPHMFSSRFPATTSLAQSGLLRYQSEPLHTSLTLLQSADSRRAAVKTFRNILAFMGDRPLSKPVALGHEVLTLGYSTPELRDEILLQLCKQLSGNPSIASATRGWALLYMCLCTFHPSDEFENHLELWLRENGAVPCVWAMHLGQYRGGPGPYGVPGTAEIATALERARAPPLPTFVQDADSAGTLVEYASVEPPIGSAAEASMVLSRANNYYSNNNNNNNNNNPNNIWESKATAEAKDVGASSSSASFRAASRSTGASKDPYAISSLAAEFEKETHEDHAMQVALLRATAGAYGGPATRSYMVGGSADAIPATPPAPPSSSSSSSSSSSAITHPVDLAYMNILQGVPGLLSQQQQQQQGGSSSSSTVIAGKRVTPTKPGVDNNNNWMMNLPAPGHSSRSSIGGIGGGPLPIPPSLAASLAIANSASSSSGLLNSSATAGRPITPLKPGETTLGSTSVGGAAMLALAEDRSNSIRASAFDNDLESRIAAISRALEDV